MSTFPRWLKVALVVAAVLMLGGFAWYYRAQQQRRLQEVVTNLETIIQPKIDWIEQWRINRENQAALVAADRLYVSSAVRWAKTHPKAQEITAVWGSFRRDSARFLSRDILLVNPDGRILLRMNPLDADLAGETRNALVEALRKGKHILTDLYLTPDDRRPQMDFVVPLFDTDKDSSAPVGAVIYQFDVLRIYFRMLEYWPVETDTAEVQILRREGDSVLFLNEMRHQKGTALSHRIFLSDKENIEVQAASGKEGALQGEDYRGIKVVAFAKAAPGHPWIVIVKQDESEAFAGLRSEFAVVAAVFAFLVLCAATALGVLWQRKEKAYYQALFEAEAAQRKSDLRYQNTLDGMMEGCLIIDFEWRCTYVNAAAVRQFRRKKEEMLGGNAIDSIPGIQDAVVLGALQRCMGERKPQHVECSLNLSDGTRQWYEFSIQPIQEGIFVVTNDITQRKQAEESLRESEARYRALFEHMDQGIVLLQADGWVVDVNPAALKLFGLSKNEFERKASNQAEWKMFHEDDSPFLIEEYPAQMALKTGSAAHAAMGMWNPSRESRIWLEVSAAPLFQAEDPKPYQVLVTLHDITDRKRAQAEHDRLASAIEQSGEVVVIIDTNGIIQYANPVFETVTGYAREEAIGGKLPALITDSQDEEFHRRFWETLRSGKPWKGRLTNRKKDGSLYTDEATVSPVFNSSGAIVNYVSVTRDITEYLKLQREKERLQAQFLQMQKIESVGRLAGGVAHDFNNMLSVITGHTQMALGSLDSTHPLHMHLQEINKAALRSTDLTRQLLAFARKQTISPRVLNLNHTVGGMLSMLQRLIGEDIDLSWSPGPRLWSVRIDPTQIDQILTNLAVNSRDAIEKHGKVAIETNNVVLDGNLNSGQKGLMPGEYVLLSFSDDGCGMDKEVIDHLFEPFFTTKEVGKGTGLGLATVYGIVRQNEGFINIYSEAGKGTTLKIYFPRYSGHKTDTAGARARTEPPQGGIETVLLVEDEASVLKLTKLMLEQLGYTVIAASSPSEALRLAEIFDGDLHLLLVDVVLPEMTGRELSEKLGAIRPGLRSVFMSGYTDDVIAHRGVLDEGVHFIQKPFTAKTLSAILREVLEG